MALDLSLIQDERVNYTVRQGNAFVIEIDYPEANLTTPSDITGYTFFSELRDNTADDSTTPIHTFSLTPDTNGNYYEVDYPNAKTKFHFSDNLSRTLKPKKQYFFESKTLDAGIVIDSVVVYIEAVSEYARGTI